MDFFGLFHIRTINLWDVLDILLMWLLIYQLLKILHGTRAMQMVFGIISLFLVQVVADILHLTVLEKIISSLLTIIPIAVIVLFQAEIRKALISIGRNPFLNLVPEPERSFLDSVFLAVRHFSEQRIGAILVFENTQSLAPYVEIGTVLDAVPSYDLLLNIFEPKSNLHDGAVIIVEGRIANAASVLPLTTKTNLPKHFGTRHRAGIGISEETDCLVVIVSEESGQITFVKDGTRYTPSDTSSAKLRQLFEAIMDAGKSKIEKTDPWWRRVLQLVWRKKRPKAVADGETPGKKTDSAAKSARST
ncbi:MAG: diadenylate cyclase CdaA [Acidobacteria bacterium]|nr:diadenylate cyclase CdaA [Acidobacteriota bacterium]